MGMSASQARLLFVSSRMNDLELKSQQIANTKIRLADESEQVANKYTAALNKTKLTINNPVDNSKQLLTYAQIMSPEGIMAGAYNLQTNEGKVVVSSQVSSAFEKSKNLNEFLSNLSISRSNNSVNIDNYTQAQAEYNEAKTNTSSYLSSKGVTVNSNGTLNFPTTTTRSSDSYEVTGRTSVVGGKEISRNTSGNTTTVTSRKSNDTSGTDSAGRTYSATTTTTGVYTTTTTTATVNTTDNTSSGGTGNTGSTTGTTGGQTVNTTDGSSSGASGTGGTGGITGGSTVNTADGSSSGAGGTGGTGGTTGGSTVNTADGSSSGAGGRILNSNFQSRRDVEDLPYNVDFSDDYRSGASSMLRASRMSVGSTSSTSGSALKIAMSSKSLGADELTLEKKFELDDRYILEGYDSPFELKYRFDEEVLERRPIDDAPVPDSPINDGSAITGNPETTTTTTTSAKYTETVETVTTTHKYSVTEENSIQSNYNNLKNIESAAKKKYDTAAANYQSSGGDNAPVSSNESYYTNLYNSMVKGGYQAYDNASLTSSQYLQYQLEQGQWYLAKKDDQGQYQKVSISSTALVSETTDKTDLAKAEAEYNAETSKINRKEKILDNKLKEIDTEHQALKTELDSVKGLIKDNIDKSFNLFS